MNERCDRLCGITQKMRVSTKSGEYSFYVTLNFDNGGEPYEIFINCKNSLYYEHMSAASQLISKMLQNGINKFEISKILKSIYSIETNHFHNGKMIPSLYHRIGELLETI